MSTKSQSEHVLELSRELLDDIELGRLDADKLLLKCSRLARLAGSEEIQKWIGFEMGGYISGDQVAMSYMGRTGRWTDFAKKVGFWGPLAEQEAAIEAQTAQLATLKIGDVSGDAALLTVNKVLSLITHTSAQIMTLSGIRSRVLALLHAFVAEVYYQREFASLAESTFERYKHDIDALIAAQCGEVLTKIPSVIDRLAEGGEEGVSQALTTCRRILEAFADAVFPATDATIMLGGNELSLDASKHQNRINAYISQHTTSASRQKKLRQNLANLFDRVSTGVHDDVTPEEAYSLFLNTYLFLGEVLVLSTAHLASPG